MAGNGRFDSNSTSPDSSFAGNHGQKGGYSGISLDRCGSFREVSDGRVLNSNKVASRGSSVNAGDVSNLSQCLMLEPFAVGDQKCPKPTELKKALGIPIGCLSEENSLSTSHLRNSPPVSIEDLKRIRATVADNRARASGRARKMDEQLHRLNKYFEARSSKKQQRNDILPSERGGGGIMKMGNQINRSTLDLAENKSEDRPKNGILNKRVRTSMAETRAEARNSGLMKQPLMMPKDRDTNSADSDVGLDIKRRLPAGGESWDKRMKRKRSGGAGGPRNFDGEGEAKRTMHQKLSSESSLQSTDSQAFRSGTNDFCGRAGKMDATPSLSGSGSRTTLKIEQDKATLSGEKARLLPKGNIKLSNREENDVDSLSPAITKGKLSRAPRSSSNVPMNLVSNVPRVSGTLESWEMPQSMPKSASINGTNNRKRAIPPSPSSSPITQWGGQRPQKNTRTRRGNLHSPVSNHEEVQTPTEGFSPSDFSARLQSSGANNSLLSKGLTSGMQIAKASPKVALSPSMLSDSEESGPGGNRLQGKKFGCSGLEEKTVNATQSAGSSPMLMKKGKLLVKEESIDGLRRLGRSEKDSVSRASISPAGEKPDIAAVTKPPSVSHGSDKSGSKSGRPMKKLSERKGYTRLGHLNGGSPDFNGEVDDDREELIAAANLAYNHCVIAAKGKLWKTAEALFTSVRSEKKSYLLQQLKITEELQQSLSQTLGYCNNIKGDYMQEEISLSDTLSEERSRSAQSKSESKDIASPVESVDQGKRSSSCGGVGIGRKFENITSLYQRVLSALIMVDDVEECDQNGWDGCLLPHGASLDSPDEASLLVNDDVKVDRMEFECESVFGLQTTSNGSAYESLSYHTNNTLGRLSAFQDSPCNGGTPVRENGCLNSEVQVLVGLSSSDSDGAQSHGSSSIDCPYEQLPIENKLMLELHSIGLYPETVPDLHDKEDEVINEEIIQLKSGLQQQVGKKKAYLDKIYEALQGGKDVEGQELEQVAMDKLVEMAHKRLVSTRGNRGSKHGIPKVSKQVALGYARRTVARCRKFENSGASCFSEPGLHDIIFAPPPRFDEAETWPGDGLAALLNCTDGEKGNASEMSSRQSDQSFAKNGPILNRGKKKEVSLDAVGGASNRTAPLDSPLSGVKWKRSERDNSRHGSMKNGNAKAGRSSLLNSRGERKPKTKPKQKTAQLSTPSNGVNLKFSPGDSSGQLFNGAGIRRREGGVESPNNLPLDSSMEVKRPVGLPNPSLNDIESIEELDGTGGIGGDQDLNSWFSEVDGLQDHDPTEGLSIPMDDISDLFF